MDHGPVQALDLARLRRSALDRIRTHAAADGDVALRLWREHLASGALAAVLDGAPA